MVSGYRDPSNASPITRLRSVPARLNPNNRLTSRISSARSTRPLSRSIKSAAATISMGGNIAALSAPPPTADRSRTGTCSLCSRVSQKPACSSNSLSPSRMASRNAARVAPAIRPPALLLPNDSAIRRATRSTCKGPSTWTISRASLARRAGATSWGSNAVSTEMLVRR